MMNADWPPSPVGITDLFQPHVQCRREGARRRRGAGAIHCRFRHHQIGTAGKQLVRRSCQTIAGDRVEETSRY